MPPRISLLLVSYRALQDLSDVIWEYMLILSLLSADQTSALYLGDIDIEYFCTYLSRAA